MRLPPSRSPTHPLRRRACLGVVAWAGLALAGVARAALPAVNLALHWRLVPWPPAAQPAAVPPGTVTVGTTNANATSPPPGSVTTRTVPAPDLVGGQRLLVRNGGQARLALRRDDRNDPPDWVWTPQGQGIQSAPHRAEWHESLWVQVQWPGGAAPAQLSYRFAQPLPDAGRADAAQQLDGELLAPLDQWLELGHWAAPDGSGQALQVRLARVP